MFQNQGNNKLAANGVQRMFQYQGNQVRTLLIDGEPWFVAKDICDVLEIANSRQAVSYLDDDEKASVIINDGSQDRSKQVIN